MFRSHFVSDKGSAAKLILPILTLFLSVFAAFLMATHSVHHHSHGPLESNCTLCNLVTAIGLGGDRAEIQPPVPAAFDDLLSFTLIEVLPRSFLWLKSGQSRAPPA